MNERVYVQTNAADGNRIVIFDRSSDGTLIPLGSLSPLAGLPPQFDLAFGYHPAASIPTGGLGTGGVLPSQGALALSSDGRYLFAVNAGSNEISSLAVTADGLRLLDKVPSGGIEPRSLTVHDELLYVVNGFGTGQIAGFKINLNGRLTPLEGSIRSLKSRDSAPVQVSFNRDGTLLVVSELFADRISVFQIGEDGLPKGLKINQSAGESPFGFAFSPRGHLIVSESVGFRPNASVVSSYRVDRHGSLSVISSAVPTMQTAACWIVNTPDGRYSYASNTGSGSISGYRVDSKGKLTLLDDTGRTGVTGATSLPVDMVITADGLYLYVLNQAKQTVGAFIIGSDGSLAPLPSAGNLPPLCVGLAIG